MILLISDRTFVWAVSLDDTNGTAASALSQSTNQIALSELSISLGSSSDYPGCVITDCAKTCALPFIIFKSADDFRPVCPIGKSAVQQTNGNVQNAIIPGCPSGQTRTYCCTSNDLPSCHWIGSARLCINDKCASDEIELTTDTSNCWFNHKTLCCTKSLYQIEQGTCCKLFWFSYLENVLTDLI
jgi:chitinase